MLIFERYTYPRLFSSIDSITEPHRFTSIIACLAGMTRQIVRQTANFSQGQTYILPLLMRVLPGIDSNDYRKTTVTFQFLNHILKLITCVDCSSAVQTRVDLSDVSANVRTTLGEQVEHLRFRFRLKRMFACRQKNSKISLVNFSIEHFK
jgi:hypothetical protein